MKKYPDLAMAFLDAEKITPEMPDKQITEAKVVSELHRFRDDLKKPINCWMCEGFIEILKSDKNKIMASWMWHFCTCRSVAEGE